MLLPGLKNQIRNTLPGVTDQRVENSGMMMEKVGYIEKLLILNQTLNLINYLT